MYPPASGAEPVILLGLAARPRFRRPEARAGGRGASAVRAGREPAARRAVFFVYWLLGRCMMSSASPCSTMRPLCMTMIRSASMSTTARSWVMNRQANPISTCSFLNSSRTLACTDTSSALVGSSAISSDGLSASARASEARCRWPPDSSCGNRLMYALAAAPSPAGRPRTPSRQRPTSTCGAR